MVLICTLLGTFSFKTGFILVRTVRTEQPLLNPNSYLPFKYKALKSEMGINISQQSIVEISLYDSQ